MRNRSRSCGSAPCPRSLDNRTWDTSWQPFVGRDRTWHRRQSQELTLDVAAQAIGLVALRIGRPHLLERDKSVVQPAARRERATFEQGVFTSARQRKRQILSDWRSRITR